MQGALSDTADRAARRTIVGLLSRNPGNPHEPIESDALPTKPSPSSAVPARWHSSIRAAFDTFNDFAQRWVRKRFAIPLVVGLSIALLVVSEYTYLQTTSTLRGGITLTDARIQTMRLLQLLTAAETAQFALLATGQTEYLAQVAEAKAALPEVQAGVTGFLASQGAEGAAAAQRVADVTRRRFAQFDRTRELVQAGELGTAADLARSDEGRNEMLALRNDLANQLTQAASLQQQARTSIYDALLVNRLAVGSLTLVALLSLLLFLKQLKSQDRERRETQSALLEERERLEVQVQRRTARLAELARHLQSVREDERARLARELHDELGGLLTASKLGIARARMKSGDPSEVLLRLERVNEHLNKGIELKRRIIENLRPSALSTLGLTSALQGLCDETSASLSIAVHLSAVAFHLSPQAELAVYRFVQEALTNIGKYASATRVDVALRVVDGNAFTEVRDNGVGFDPQASRVGRHGLSGMQFRAESLGGTMSVCSAPGSGTTVRIEFPQSAQEQVAA